MPAFFSKYTCFGTYLQYISVLIRRLRIFSTSFLVMVLLAKRLPVAPVPEKLRVAAVRDDMIYHRGFHELSFLAALGAQWMVLEEHF